MTEKKAVKGQWGGARANSGGAREGAGRPPNEPEYLPIDRTYEDPKNFLLDVMNCDLAEEKWRIDAAKAVMPYIYQKGSRGRIPDAPEDEPVEFVGADSGMAKSYLLGVMNDMRSESKSRMDAAKALMPYFHRKIAEIGKKEAKQEEAEKVNQKFTPMAPPSKHRTQ